MRATRIASALIASLSILANGCGGGLTGAASMTSGDFVKGTKATDFASRDVDGKTIRLSDYLGKDVILIDFWATWCEPCLAEMPHLRRMYEANKSRGFVVLAVTMDGPETIAEVPNFAKRNGMTFPVVMDEDSHVASQLNPKKSAPFSVLIDRQGNVMREREGYNPGDEVLIAADVAKLLDSSASPK
jgi:peroxiredoxin